MEQQYQIATEIFGEKSVLPTKYSFDDALDACLEAAESFKRIGKEKPFYLVMVA